MMRRLTESIKQGSMFAIQRHYDITTKIVSATRVLYDSSKGAI